MRKLPNAVDDDLSPEEIRFVAYEQIKLSGSCIAQVSITYLTVYHSSTLCNIDTIFTRTFEVEAATEISSYCAHERKWECSEAASRRGETE